MKYISNLTQFLAALSLGTVILMGSVGTVQAQESSPSATETTRQLKERIQRIIDEKKDQVMGAIDELSQQKTGFIGEVQRVTEESVTINNRKGTRILPIDSQTTLLRDGDEVEIGDIAVGEWLVVMGIEANDTFVPLRILISSDSLRPRNHIVELGSITDKTVRTLNVETRKEEDMSFNLTSATEYQDADGEPAAANDFIEDLQVLVVGYENDEGKTATVIRALAPLSDLQANE